MGASPRMVPPVIAMGCPSMVTVKGGGHCHRSPMGRNGRNQNEPKKFIAVLTSRVATMDGGPCPHFEVHEDCSASTLQELRGSGANGYHADAWLVKGGKLMKAKHSKHAQKILESRKSGLSIWSSFFLCP